VLVELEAQRNLDVAPRLHAGLARDQLRLDVLGLDGAVREERGGDGEQGKQRARHASQNTVTPREVSAANANQVSYLEGQVASGTWTGWRGALGRALAREARARPRVPMA
jgi:hypothetical protein